MLKGAVRSNAYITLIISGGGNGIKWIFLEEYLWTNLLSDISIDLLKVGLAVLAGAAATYFSAKFFTSVIVAKAAGLFIGISTGVGLAFLPNDDVSKGFSNMAQEMALVYFTVYDAALNPLGFVNEKGEQAKDLMICTTTGAAGWAVIKIEAIIRDNVNRKLRQLLNPPSRLY